MPFMGRVIRGAALVLFLLLAQGTLAATSIYTEDSQLATAVCRQRTSAEVIELYGDPISGAHVIPYMGAVSPLASGAGSNEAPEPRTTVPLIAIGAAGLLYARSRRKGATAPPLLRGTDI